MKSKHESISSIWSVGHYSWGLIPQGCRHRLLIVFSLITTRPRLQRLSNCVYYVNMPKHSSQKTWVSSFVRTWFPLAVVITGLMGAVLVTVQQNFRQSAN